MYAAHGRQRGREKFNVLIRYHEGNRSLRRSRRGWEDGVKINVVETGYESVDRIYAATGRGRIFDHLSDCQIVTA
jgi:hypothetical protein